MSSIKSGPPWQSPYPLPLHGCAIERPALHKMYFDSLLEVYPAAATVVNSDGRLPLHCLLEAQHTWHFGGIKELVYAHPNALQTLNIKMNLFPVQMAARNANRSLGHLSTLLEVLLSAPEMVNICK